MNSLDEIEEKYNEITERINLQWLNTVESQVTEWYNYIMGLPERDRIIYEVVLFDSQVRNGGFNQYFYNGYGQFSMTTVKSLVKIGATHKASLLTKALMLVNCNNYSYDNFRKKLVAREIRELIDSDELDNALGHLDNEYYDSFENIISLLVNYHK
jgi:hypothetical protein